MSQKVFLSLHEKDGGDPLDDHFIEGLLEVDLVLPQNTAHGNFFLNLYVGEEYIGYANIVWEGTLEFKDPLAGHYLFASAHIDEVETSGDFSDAQLHTTIKQCIRRCGMSFHKEIRTADETRDFIVAIKRTP